MGEREVLPNEIVVLARNLAWRKTSCCFNPSQFLKNFSLYFLKAGE